MPAPRRSCPRLEALREEAGLTVRDLARDVGISTAAMRRIASGYSRPRFTTALRIAEVLGADVEDIFGDD
jgi:DNA-binding XRE family transcriptional regulator